MNTNELIDRWCQLRHPHVWLVDTGDTHLATAWRNSGAQLRHTHLFAGAHQAHEALGIPSTRPLDGGTTGPEDNQPWDIVWQWPKSKPLASMLAHWLSTQVAADSQLWVVGQNRGGVRSVPGMLDPIGWQVQKVGSMRRQSLYLATRTRETIPAFNPAAYWSAFRLPGLDATVKSLPGVFSHGRIDPGTRLLLPWLGQLGLTGHALDFGCGAGVISLALATQCPGISDITALDHDWLAVCSTVETAATNNSQWRTLWSDHWSGLDGAFDVIVTNPPFHEGLEVQYDTTRRLLAEARDHCRPGATFLAVVNQHLPYGDWLNAYLNNLTCLEKANGYAIWQGIIRP